MSEAEDHEEAWALLKACPHYYHDAEESPKHWITMNDVWGWACADGFELTAANVDRVADLYDRYGFGGLLLAHKELEPGHYASEFRDNNRFLQFAEREEQIRKRVPDSNRRAYHRAVYLVGLFKPAPSSPQESAPQEGDLE